MPHVPSSDAARTRAIKRYVWARHQRFVATCALGVEPLLTAEVAALPGAATVAPRPGGIVFEAPFDTLYQALLTLRTAESLRVVLAPGVAATTYPMLHDQLTRVRWSLWLPERCAITVRVVSRGSRLRDAAGLEHALRGALRRHGVDCDADGSDASDGDGAPPFTIHLRIEQDRASASLDLGGALYRRSGDKWVSRTTIRETTAAALVRHADVPRADLVLDPFCGSGTLLAEALEAALGLPPGRRRTPPFAASPAWKLERARHASRQVDAPVTVAPPRLVGRDVDERAVAITRRNLEAAGLLEHVALGAGRAQDLDLAALVRDAGATAPLLLSNPPYGKAATSLGAPPDELLRDVLSNAAGWRFALLFPDPDVLANHPAVLVEQRLPVVTGGLRNAFVLGLVRP